MKSVCSGILSAMGTSWGQDRFSFSQRLATGFFPVLHFRKSWPGTFRLCWRRRCDGFTLFLGTGIKWSYSGAFLFFPILASRAGGGTASWLHEDAPLWHKVCQELSNMVKEVRNTACTTVVLKLLPANDWAMFLSAKMLAYTESVKAELQSPWALRKSWGPR